MNRNTSHQPLFPLMRILPAIFICLIPLLVMSQQGGRLAFEGFPTIKKTTMLVVLPEGDDAYNQAILKAVNTYWELMPVEAISIVDLEEYGRNEAYSMLVLDNSERIRHTVDGDDVIRRNHLALYHCNRGEYLKAYGGKEAVTQWAFFDVSETDAFNYKLTGLIQAMHNYLTFLDTAGVNEDTHNKKLDVFRNYQADQLKEKTLLVNPEDLPEGLTIEAIQAAYAFDLQKASRKDIQAALDSQDPSKAFLHTGPDYSDLTIISTREGTILYQSKPTERLQLRVQDFQSMKATIESPPVPQESMSEKLDKFGKAFQGKFKRKKKKKDD